MNIKANDARRPVSIVVIGAGNRANKYLEYAKINPDKVQLVGVVELNDIRRSGTLWIGRFAVLLRL